MSKKKIIINVTILLLIFGLTIFYLIKNDLGSYLLSLSEVPFTSYLIILSLVLLTCLLDSSIIFSTMKMFNAKAKFHEGVGAYFLGNLGSSITPSKAGHFPFMIYYYNKRDYNLEESLTIPLNNQFIYSPVLIIVYLAIGITGNILNFNVMIGSINFPSYIVCYIGAFTNALYFTFSLVVCSNLRFQNFVLNIESKFLKKIKRIDDEEAFKAEKRFKMQVFKKCFNNYLHHFKDYLLPMLYYIIFILITFGLPYFIFIVLSYQTFNFFDFLYFFTLTQASAYVSNVIPVPGGMGTMEFSFLTVFTLIMGESIVYQSLIIYRVATYFFVLFIDIIVFIIFFIKNVKMTKNSQKNQF